MTGARKAEGRSARERFRELGADAPRLCSTEPGLLAYVTPMAGFWAWVVWRDGQPAAGNRSLNLTQEQACREALDCLESLTAIEADCKGVARGA